MNKITIAEYSAISTQFSSVINFRVLVFSFFIAVISLTFMSNMGNVWKSLFLIIFTLIIWALELRNREVSHILLIRGCDIENSKQWKDCLVEGIPYFNRMLYGSKGKNSTNESDEVIKVFWFSFKNLQIGEDLYFFTHRFVLDITYALTIVFSIISLIVNIQK